MKEIKIRKIQEPSVKLFNPDGELIGVIDNNLSFLDVRLQIAQNQVPGYYVEYKEKKIKLSEYGGLEDYAEGLFDQMDDLLENILSISSK